MTLTGTLRHVLHILQIKTRDLHLKVGLPTYNQTHSTVLESCQRLTKDFYKANTAQPTKTPTDFDKYVTAAYYFTRTITVTNLLTVTITNKHNDDFELYVTIDRSYKANATLPTKTLTDFLIRDCRHLFQKNDYSDEFIDTNYYKQYKQTTLSYTRQKIAFTKHTALCRRKHQLTLINTWLPPS